MLLMMHYMGIHQYDEINEVIHQDKAIHRPFTSQRCLRLSVTVGFKNLKHFQVTLLCLRDTDRK